jgi:hypothetical protein
MVRMRKKPSTEGVAFIAYKKYADAVADLRGLASNKRDLALIERYKAYTDYVEAAAGLLKEAVRPFAKVGETVKHIFTEDDVVSEVSVTGLNKSRTYDAEKAWRLWPEKIIRQVMVVDARAVRALIEEGDLPERLALKAAYPDVEDTPRVRIELLDVPRKKKP